MKPPTAVKVMEVVSEVWDNRPADDDDWETDFLEMTQLVCALSTQRDEARWTAFVEDEQTGYPLFADPKNVAEFNLGVLPDQTFVLYPWAELKVAL